jgi:hypothetical protein
VGAAAPVSSLRDCQPPGHDTRAPSVHRNAQHKVVLGHQRDMRRACLSQVARHDRGHGYLSPRFPLVASRRDGEDLAPPLAGGISGVMARGRLAQGHAAKRMTSAIIGA